MTIRKALPGALLTTTALVLTACGSDQQRSGEGYNGATAAGTPDPDLRPGRHHVTYTWGVSRKLKAGEDQNIGISWNNPGTGAHELPPETSATSTTPLRFPYSVQFDVTDLHADNQHVAARIIGGRREPHGRLHRHR